MGSGIEVEGELLVASGASLLYLSHCIASSLTQAMGFEPAFHPDVAALWLPDLDQFERATTTRAEERIVTETGLDALALGKMLSGNEQGLDIEEGELEAEGLQSGEQDGCDLMFEVAGIEAGVAHHLHALGRNVGDQERDEIQSRAGHRLAQVCGSVDIPKDNLVSIVAGQMGSCQRRMAKIAADVFSSIEAFRVETLGIDLETTMVMVTLGDGALQIRIMGVRLTQGLAEQVTPFGGQTVAGDLIDLHPSIFSQTAFGDDQMNMGFKAEVASEGVDGVDHAEAHIWIEIFQDFTDGLSGDLQEEFQQRGVGEEERS